MKIYVSKDIYKETLNNILSYFPNSKVIKMQNSKRVSDSVSSHPDIFMCKLGISQNSKIFMGKEDNLGKVYPRDCLYNACVTEDFFIHNEKITDYKLLSEAINIGKNIVHVSQGYCRCSCLPLGRNGIITSDRGIYKSCLEKGFADFKTFDKSTLNKSSALILLIDVGHILLKNHKYGFIGGCAGQIDDVLFFNGDITKHPNYEDIRNFAKFYDLKISFSTPPLADIGSILCKC